MLCKISVSCGSDLAVVVHLSRPTLGGKVSQPANCPIDELFAVACSHCPLVLLPLHLLLRVSRDRWHFAVGPRSGCVPTSPQSH